MLHLPGGVCGARVHAVRPQLLQGLPAGLLGPQQEVLLPHVQEELQQAARAVRQPRAGRDRHPVPGVVGAGGERRGPECHRVTGGLASIAQGQDKVWRLRPGGGHKV